MKRKIPMPTGGPKTSKQKISMPSMSKLYFIQTMPDKRHSSISCSLTFNRAKEVAVELVKEFMERSDNQKQLDRCNSLFNAIEKSTSFKNMKDLFIEFAYDDKNSGVTYNSAFEFTEANENESIELMNI